jgi:hypothetical protein
VTDQKIFKSQAGSGPGRARAGFRIGVT